ncbi:MAG: preprotein translocase subunit SecA [Planctomycetes bacterium]|nr:preprotein translocase subunit SecA [Planctomycetota bacterium]
MVDWDKIEDRLGLLGLLIGKLLRKLFGSRTERVVSAMRPQVQRINELESWAQQLSEEQVKAKVAEWKADLQKLQTEAKAEGVDKKTLIARVNRRLDELLPECFALVREASKRTIGLRHFDVQLIGGMVLHQGDIAEMATGEGKTLVATLPAALNALAGRGVYVVTVNDYLARRDKDWMAPVYSYLGLTAGAIQSDFSADARHPHYAADITYGTNNEFGFDYLRDNMKLRVEDQVQKNLFFAIVDEVDSILVDEARTPLIISGPAEQSSEKYAIADRIARRLKKDVHFEADEKDHRATLTEDGIVEAQNLAGVEDFYSGGNQDWPHHIEQALRAHHIYKKDKDYVVEPGQDGHPEIVIVDEFTGRKMHGRRWSDGLHQAVECKEGIQARAENQTLATITFQNYFRLFDKLAGMTGTALTEAAEFAKIYDLEVVQIPTNRPIARLDKHDVVYVREQGKWNAMAAKITELQQKGQPVLVGTTSIEKSERLSTLLRSKGIKHEVLNAKQHEREALIVAQAGRKGAVTVSTNMAGRGTDIVLGGNPELMWRERVRAQGLTPDDPRAQELRTEVFALAESEKAEVKSLGGLFVLGSERHEARRIDNQLRGRSGRQGDPGESVFLLSLEDDLMRIFYRDWVRGFMERLGMSDDAPIESGMVSRAIAKAQRKVEQRNFEIRKNLLEYDEVMDVQRKEVYGMRQDVLEGFELRERVDEMMREVLGKAISEHLGDGKTQDPNYDALAKFVRQHFGVEIDLELLRSTAQGDHEVAGERIMDALRAAYDRCEQENQPENMRKIERYLLLQAIDGHWKEHLYAMDALRAGIGLRGYAQQDPKNEYKREGYENYERTMGNIARDLTGIILKVRLAPPQAPPPGPEGQGSQGTPPPRPAAPGVPPGTPPGSSGAPRPPQAPPQRPPQPRRPGSGYVPVGYAFDAYSQQKRRAEMMQAREQAAREKEAADKGEAPPQPPAPPEPKIDGSLLGRNDLCPCGSGKKYKKCHGLTG